MKLSKNFNLAELIKTNVRQFDNMPNMTAIDNLQLLVDNVLQPVRDHFGPVVVTSGYRSPEVNKAIGGSASSDHCKGMAADFEVFGVPNKVVAEWVRDNCKFRQLILEFPGANPNDGWVHAAFNKDDLKGQVLTAKKINGKTQYLPGLV
jgi:zinc D-Ala-D-Ala carboxypeptidase